MRFIADEDLERAAIDFLKTHHPTLSIPVPIEHILTKNLKIKMVPVGDLKSDFGIDGCLSRDMKYVYVDTYLMMNVEFRTRFTIAHEIGHLTLHSSYINDLQPTDVMNWKQLVLAESQRAWSRMEYQAHQFAGCCLVPTEKLCQFVADINDNGGSENKVREVAKKFHVSDDVARRRLAKSGLG